MAKKQSEYVSLSDAARALHVSRATAYIWALSGRIPAQLIAGRYAVRRATLRKVVAREHARQRSKPRPPCRRAEP